MVLRSPFNPACAIAKPVQQAQLLLWRMALCLLVTGCAVNQEVETADIDPAAPEAVNFHSEASPSPSQPSPSTPQGDPFEAAINSASSAIALSESAFSAEDWQLVASRWQRAIALLEQVPQSSPRYEAAQAKLQEYQNNLSYAQQQVKQPTPNRTIEIRPRSAQSGPVASSRSFASLCDDLERLSEETQPTVQALLTSTGASDCEAADEALQNTTELNLAQSEITDLRPLQSLTQLTRLSLNSNAVTDLKPLQSLTRLQELSLSANQIRDVSPLTSLTQLKTLRLDNNQIRDVGPLSAIAGLETLDLSNNQIEDAQPLAALTQLTVLSLNGNQIRDISPLKTLTELQNLFLTDNPIRAQDCPVEPASICEF